MLAGEIVKPVGMMVVALSRKTRILIIFIAVCMSYQVQFTLRAKDTVEEIEYDNADNDGDEYCRAWCHDAHTNDCVASQWIEKTKK